MMDKMLRAIIETILLITIMIIMEYVMVNVEYRRCIECSLWNGIVIIMMIMECIMISRDGGQPSDKRH